MNGCLLKWCLLEEVVELLDSADAPLESLAGVPQVAHDEPLLPPEPGHELCESNHVITGRS